MSLQAILAKIENDAKAQADEILQSALDEQKKAIHVVKSRIKERHNRDAERIRNKVEANARQLKSHSRREMEKALLSHRRQIVDSVISDSVKNIASSPDYLDLMSILLGECDLDGKVEVVICTNDAERITQAFLKELSTEKRQFVLAEDKHTDHGGILMRSGDISLNATLSMISELNHDAMVMELSRLLPLEGQVE